MAMITRKRAFLRSTTVSLAFAVGIALILVPTIEAIGDEAAKPRLVAKVEPKKEIAGDLRFSPDGKTLAVKFSGKQILLWDVATRTVRDTFKDVAIVCNDFAFAPDGKCLVLIDISRVHSLDLTTRVSKQLYKHSDDAFALTFSLDGKLLASGDTKGQVIVWDYTAGKELATFKCPGLVDRKGLLFYPDGKTLVAAGIRSTEEKNVSVAHFERWIFDLEHKSLRHTFEDAGNAAAMAVSPDSKTLVAQGKEREVWLWDTSTHKVRDRLMPNSGYAYALAFSADGQVLFGAGGEPLLGGLNPGIVTAWDTRTGKELVWFKAIADTIHYMALSPDGKLLAVSCGSYGVSQDFVAVWDVSSIRSKPAGK